MATAWITDDEADRALDWLVSNAPKIGEAKKRLVLAERMVDRTKALVMKKFSELPVSAQEREAKASDELFAAYKEEAEAAGAFQTLLAYRDAASARVDAWRSINATLRGARLAA
jgi:nucleotide-binding universal stress UspA family protein